MKRKQKNTNKPERPEPPTHRNKPLHIPLEFNKAVEGLLNVKPKPKQPKPDEKT